MAEEQNNVEEKEGSSEPPKEPPKESQKEPQNEEPVKTSEKGGLIGKLKLPILVLLVASLAVGSALIVTKVAKGNGEKKKTEVVKEEKKELGKFITLDPFTVNLAGGTNYLQTAIAFEIKSDNEELAKEIEERKPQINDSVITIISAKSIEEIDTAPERNKLKSEIKKAVDSMLSYGKIERVYFSTFIMQ